MEPVDLNPEKAKKGGKNETMEKAVFYFIIT